MAGIFGIVSKGAPVGDVLARMGALLRHSESERVDSRVMERPGAGTGAGTGAGSGAGSGAAPAAGLGVVHLGTVHPTPPIAYDAKSGALAVMDGEIFADEAGGAPCPEGMTEVEHMLALFLRGGPAALAKTDGHWSLAVIEADGTTTLIADHFGSRQLLYRRLAGGGIAFFTELKGALALPGETLRFDPHGIAQLFLLQAPLGETTTLEGVTLVPQGAFVRLRAHGAFETGTYWSAPPPTLYDTVPPGDWIEEYASRLERSVAVRTLKPPLTGATVSGGHDSRLYAAAIPESVRPLHTFTFGHPRCYDRRSARRIARVIKSTHHEFDMSRETYFAGLHDYMWSTDAMVACRHGQIAALRPALKEHVGAVLEGVPGAAMNFYMQYFQGFGLYAPIDEDEYVRQHFAARNKLPPADAARLLTGRFSSAAAEYPGEVYHNAIGRGFPAFAGMRAIDIAVRQRLRRFSNMGACFLRSTVEIRQPLYEHALYECSLRMPPALYVNGLKAYADVLRRLDPKFGRILVDKTRLPPDATLFDQFWCWRKNGARNFLNRFAGGRFRPYDAKRTFNNQGWVSGDFWKRMKDVILSESLAGRDLFDADEVRKYVTSFDEKRRIPMDALWTIYTLELWCRRAFDRGGEA